MVLEESILDKALSRYYNHNTIATYKAQLLPLVGRELTVENVARWAYDSAGMSRSTITVRRAAISMMLEFCVVMGFCSESFASKVRAIKFPKGKPPKANGPITISEVDRLFSATQDDEELALISVLVNTGARLGSVASLTFELAEGEQTIRTKGDKYTTLYANNELKTVLQSLRDTRHASKDDYIFTNSTGGRAGYKKLYRVFKKVAERSGMPDLKPHQIRHTFATRLDSEGVSPFVIQKLLNHSSVSTTMVYVSPDKTSLEKAIGLLDRRES